MPTQVALHRREPARVVVSDPAEGRILPRMSAAAGESDALDAGLRYVTDEEPGLSRRRSGPGFSYWTSTGDSASPADRSRARALVIPPAWEAVWICTDPKGHVQATGRDAAGRKQYLYHPVWEELRDTLKYDSLAGFAAGLGELRDRVDSDLRRRGFPRDKVVALVVAIMDATLIRIGNRSYTGAVGLTTLESDHVEVGAVRLDFEFVGKGGLDHRVELSDRRLAGHVRQIQELPGQRLFTWEEDGRSGSVDSDDVNEYLRATVGDHTSAKDFRTWGGTVTVTRLLAVDPPPEEEKRQDRAILAAIDEAAEQLGNTRAVVRGSYLHPIVPYSYVSGKLHETWRAKRSGKRLDRAERVVAALLDG